MRQRVAIAMLVGVVVVAGLAAAATGDTQTIDRFDDFEDGDTKIERPHIAGWDDPENVFSVTATQISGSFSGSYVPDSDKTNQPVSATRSHLSTGWANLSTSMDGENGEQLVHQIKLKSQGSLLLELRYSENSTDNYGNLTVQDNNGVTKIGEWKESATGVQDWAINFSFPSDTAEVYLNGSSQGTFDLQTQADGWDEIELETVTFQLTSDDSELRIDDIGESFTATDPTVKNGTGSPSGDLTDSDQTLSINISDPDFADPEGDELTVRFRKAGSVIDTQTITSNGTVSTQTTFNRAGDTNWSVNATDAYGGETVSKNFTVKAPRNVTIYNETNATERLDQVNATVIFYFDDEPILIDERSTQDGRLDMSGLPADRPFVVAADAPGYVSRRVYVQSLYETQKVFLLNESEPARQPTFALRDFTGDFPAQTTVLQVQGALNESWETVEGDFFGGDGELSTTLRYNKRHRLRLINTVSGETKIFNAFFPTDNQRHVITISRDDVKVEGAGTTVDIDPDVGQLPGGNVTISSRFESGEDQDFADYNLSVYHNDSGTRTLLNSTTGAQADGETLRVRVNNSGRSGTIEVNATYTVQSGGSVTTRKNYTLSNQYNSSGIAGVLGAVPGRIGGGDGPIVLLAVFLSVTVGVAAARQYPLSTEAVGFVVIVSLAGFFLLGWVNAAQWTAVTITWTVAAAVRRGL